MIDKNTKLEHPRIKEKNQKLGTNLQSDDSSLIIPPEAYKEFKRCPHCQSVFIDDNQCEACGRVLNFNPLGEPLGPKSLYSLKEKYVENLPLITRFISYMENKQSPLAVNYKRHLDKRFILLLEAFDENNIVEKKDRRLFFNELKDLITEKVEMDVSIHSIELLIENKLKPQHHLLSQELIIHLHQERKLTLDKDWIAGLRKSFLLKALLTLVVLAFISFLAIQLLVS